MSNLIILIFYLFYLFQLIVLKPYILQFYNFNEV